MPNISYSWAFLTGRTCWTGCYLTIVVDISQLGARLPMVLRIKNHLRCTPSRPSQAHPSPRKSHHRSKLQEITAGLAISEQITSPFSAIGAALALEQAFGCHLDGHLELRGSIRNHGCECCRFTVDNDMIMIEYDRCYWNVAEKLPGDPVEICWCLIHSDSCPSLGPKRMTVPVKDAEAALKSLGMSEKGMEKDPGSIGNGRNQQMYQRLGGFQD